MTGEKVVRSSPEIPENSTKLLALAEKGYWAIVRSFRIVAFSSWVSVDFIISLKMGHRPHPTSLMPMLYYSLSV